MAFTPSFDPGRAPVPTREPRWGLGDVVVGWLIAYSATIVVGALVLTALGYGAEDTVPLNVQLLIQIPLWAGFIGVPIWAAATKGNGWIQDYRVRFVAGKDLVVGVIAGVGAQLILVPLVSAPVLRLFDRSADDLEAPARELADRAGDGPIGVLLLVLLVGIGAPIAEELFFRGLLYRSLEKRWNGWVALVGSSVVFGATHFQPLQFAGLTMAGFVFGGLVKRTDRLGPAIVAHVAFNMTTVVLLLTLDP
jgi:membrane protease YdiL (CAAX protease family)